MLKKIDAWLCRWPVAGRWVPPLLWMALIFVVSAQPVLPHAPGVFVDTLLKKVAHVVEYAVLTVLWWRVWAARRRSGAAILVAGAVAVLYAASDEFHQTFVPGRHGQVSDVLIDSIGCILAAVEVWHWERRQASS